MSDDTHLLHEIENLKRRVRKLEVCHLELLQALLESDIVTTKQQADKKEGFEVE